MAGNIIFVVGQLFKQSKFIRCSDDLHSLWVSELRL